MSGPTRADTIRPRKVKFVWRDRFPRSMISVVFGRPDQGKGLFCSDVVADVSHMTFRGRDGSIRPGRVLYAPMEEEQATMTAPRLIAAGANMENIHLWRFQLPTHFDELEMYLKVDRFDLLIIDPFAASLDGVSRRNDSIRTVLNPLTRLIEETKVAALIIEHALKHVSRRSHPLMAIGGASSGLPAAARTAFAFGKDPEDPDRSILAPVKFNIGPWPAAIAFELDTEEVTGAGDLPRLVYTEEIDDFDPLDLLVPDKRRENGRPSDKLEAASEWLTNHLYLYAPMPSKRVKEDAMQVGMSKRTVERAAARLKVVSWGNGKKVMWTLPDELRERIDRDLAEDHDEENVPTLPENSDWENALQELVDQQGKNFEEGEETSEEEEEEEDGDE